MGRKAMMTPFQDFKRVANNTAHPAQHLAAPKFNDSSVNSIVEKATKRPFQVQNLAFVLRKMKLWKLIFFGNVAQSKIANDPCVTHQFDPTCFARRCDFTLCSRDFIRLTVVLDDRLPLTPCAG
jgi:hypothetical protein